MLFIMVNYIQIIFVDKNTFISVSLKIFTKALVLITVDFLSPICDDL